MKITTEKEYVKQGQLIIMDYGIFNDVKTYRVNGHKADLQHIINTTKKLGGSFVKEPILEKTHQDSLYSVLLKIQLQAIGVGMNEQNSILKNVNDKDLRE